MCDFNHIAIQLRRGSQSLLSHKESLVAAYLIKGYTVKEIAIVFCRSISTIKTQILNIKIKCKCKTFTQLGAFLQNFIKNSP